MAQTGINQLSKEPPKDRFKRHKMSENSLELIKQRGIAKQNITIHEFEKLTNEYKKSRRMTKDNTY